MEWLPVQPELDPPESVEPILESSILLGWRTALELDWRIDAVLCSVRGGPFDGRVVPGLTVRPLVHFALDQERVVACFEAWVGDVLRANDLLAVSARELSLGPEDVLLRPLAGPVRVADVAPEAPAWWAHRNAVLEQARALDGPELEELLADYPFVVATLDHPKRLWDPDAWLRKPSAFDSVDRVHEPPSRTGPPRRVASPHLAAELYAILPAVQRCRGPAWDEASALLGPLKAYFALKLACGSGESPSEEVAAVRDWAGSRASHTRAVEGLPRLVENQRALRRRGRGLGGGRHQVQLIAPYVLPDLGVFPRMVVPSALSADLDALLLEWIRSARLERAFQIVTGRRPATFRGWGGDMEQLLKEVQEPFVRVEVRFDEGSPGERGVRALTRNGSRDGQTWVQGFGDRASVARRWFGDVVGAVG